ncbi:MAG TPA: transketolase [Gemmatimonadales bacterium]|jgi:transketolase
MTAATRTSASTDLDQLCINTIRTLAMDAVEKAKSGHPGTPMALAPLAYLLYSKVLKHNPGDPNWPDRDRFVLSCGHASMLLYSSLFLFGYGLSLDDLKQFRQWGSRTPGHPEHGHTPGVETTTGPLGQGIANAVGMAIAEAHLAATFNQPGHDVVNHFTIGICSDGDLMEGMSHEAASLAGHLKLGKLIFFYDDNHITIEGSTDLAFTDDTGKRFEAYGWQVLRVPDANDLGALERAAQAAKAETGKPSLVIVRSHIAYGAPTKHDTASAHGSPLGKDEIAGAKKFYGWPENETFRVPADALDHARLAVDRGRKLQAEWDAKMAAYSKAHPDLAQQLRAAWSGQLPDGWEKALPQFTAQDEPMATRAASQKVINALAPVIKTLMGGSADLAESTLTLIKGDPDFEPGTPAGRNMHFGIRELGMSAALNGMYLHGGLRPYGATFLVFTDYARPALRLAAIMGIAPIWVMTHDSIGLGEDGPTHQPIEHLAALRAIPNMTVIRPCDGAETAAAWEAALKQTTGPVILALTRQKLPNLDRTVMGPASGLTRGGYVLAEATGGKPAALIIGTGSEVTIALGARELLEKDGIATRVVSMPCVEYFEKQAATYRDTVLPPSVTARVAVEAGVGMGWEKWIGGRGAMVGIEHFGASAPYEKIYQEFGLTSEKVAERVRALVTQESS